MFFAHRVVVWGLLVSSLSAACLSSKQNVLLFSQEKSVIRLVLYNQKLQKNRLPIKSLIAHDFDEEDLIDQLKHKGPRILHIMPPKDRNIGNK